MVTGVKAMFGGWGGGGGVEEEEDKHEEEEEEEEEAEAGAGVGEAKSKRKDKSAKLKNKSKAERRAQQDAKDRQLERNKNVMRNRNTSASAQVAQVQMEKTEEALFDDHQNAVKIACVFETSKTLQLTGLLSLFFCDPAACVNECEYLLACELTDPGGAIYPQMRNHDEDAVLRGKKMENEQRCFDIGVKSILAHALVLISEPLLSGVTHLARASSIFLHLRDEISAEYLAATADVFPFISEIMISSDARHSECSKKLRAATTSFPDAYQKYLTAAHEQRAKKGVLLETLQALFQELTAARHGFLKYQDLQQHHREAYQKAYADIRAIKTDRWAAIAGNGDTPYHALQHPLYTLAGL